MTDRLAFLKSGLQSGNLSHDDIKWAVEEIERLRKLAVEQRVEGIMDGLHIAEDDR